MQTTTEACGKQTVIEMNTETHTGFDFALRAVSFTSLQRAETCLFVIYCNGFLGGLWLFIPLQPRNEVINCTLLTLQLKLGHFEACAHTRAGKRGSSARRLKSDSASLHPQRQCERSCSKPVMSEGQLIYVIQTREIGRTSTSTGLCSQNHMQLDKNHFHQCTQTHTHTQAYSTFNDPPPPHTHPILSTKWHNPQLHALNWHL